MVITVIVPPVMGPAFIVPAMIPPVMATPRADHDSRAVVNRRGRSVVDRRGGVVHGWGYDYRRCHTDADTDVNIGLSRYAEPHQQRRAERKAQCLEFHVRLTFEMFKSAFVFDSTAPQRVLHPVVRICCISPTELFCVRKPGACGFPARNASSTVKRFPALPCGPNVYHTWIVLIVHIFG
jgi:hypothetical protein